ncbi:hypothetical protein DPMN_161680 [Dreissena polymorpha]|uniref:Uncharacterized protein n=1 Tax=Dreissena polymorpha TaxID=45954 RepID=A0A9D4EQ25_DREPO|nr:hypothetical protein DPMN_161680 [Dreissena polymorpha]
MTVRKTGQKQYTPDLSIRGHKNAPPTGGHVFSPIWTIFELVQDINQSNVFTNLYDVSAIIVTSRVFTSHFIQLTGTIFKLNSHIKETHFLTKFHRKQCPAHWRPCFSPIWTIFELVRDINKTNVKTATPTGSHVFQQTRTTFELNQHIIKTNILTNFELDRDFIGRKLLTKFHEDRTINVAFRMFMNKCGWTDDGQTDKDRSQKLT